MLTMDWAWEQLDMKGGEEKLCKWELGRKGRKEEQNAWHNVPPPRKLSRFRGSLQRPMSPPTHEFTHPQTRYQSQFGNPPLNPLAPQLPVHWEAHLEQRFLRLDWKAWGMRGSTNWNSSGGGDRWEEFGGGSWGWISKYTLCRKFSKINKKIF